MEDHQRTRPGNRRGVAAIVLAFPVVVGLATIGISDGWLGPDAMRIDGDGVIPALPGATQLDGLVGLRAPGPVPLDGAAVPGVPAGVGAGPAIRVPAVARPVGNATGPAPAAGGVDPPVQAPAGGDDDDVPAPGGGGGDDDSPAPGGDDDGPAGGGDDDDSPAPGGGDDDGPAGGGDDDSPALGGGDDDAPAAGGGDDDDDRVAAAGAMGEDADPGDDAGDDDPGADADDG